MFSLVSMDLLRSLLDFPSKELCVCMSFWANLFGGLPAIIREFPNVTEVLPQCTTCLGFQCICVTL